MKQGIFICAQLVLVFLSGTVSFAHTPVLMCHEDDGNCECRGMFSDMSSAVGAKVIVKNNSGKVLRQSKIDEDGECIFPIPNVPYKVVMDAGQGHITDPWNPVYEDE